MRYLLSVLLIALGFMVAAPAAQSLPLETKTHTVRPGDTWLALSYQYNIPVDMLIASLGTINQQQQPTIGSTIEITATEVNNGRLLRPLSGGLLQTAARERQSPWVVAIRNNIKDPYKPLLYTPLFLPGGTAVPRELPAGFMTLSLSPETGRAGQALLLQADVEKQQETHIQMDKEPWLVHHNGHHLLALAATGAFFEQEQVHLTIHTESNPLWAQPWLFKEGSWAYEKIEFSFTPATDPELMRAERERLQEIWATISPKPLLTSTFNWPLEDYVDLTSPYGARRSINGGGYDTYHEGTDFSAYRGTPVRAPSAGKVVLAENLVVRGGAVILDHGLGIHTGYYHLSAIAVQPGQEVMIGEVLGEVGSTGRSTGNHLHWDLLIGTTWVDPEAWKESGLAAKVQNAWGAVFPETGAKDMPKKAVRYYD